MISKASNNIAIELFVDCLFVAVNALKNLLLMAEELGISRKKRVKSTIGRMSCIY
jgi:hypothetical protein